MAAEVFTAQYLERRMREHHEWREVETARLTREVVREVAIAIRQHLDAAASTRQLYASNGVSIGRRVAHKSVRT